jgi:5''-deoxy-5''-methylthioadenosine phosphorylase
MAAEAKPVLAVIGGSGVYDIPGLKAQRWESVESPFGAPSDEFLFGELGGQPIIFLPRHGRGHRLPPTNLNFRANIDALKRAGATEIVSVSAVGSLKAELAPGTFLIVDQFIDRTFARDKSFFGPGLVAHVSMADPVCRRLAAHIAAAAKAAGIDIVRGGTYLVMEGPQFSSRAESELYRSWGCDVIGMTNMPEAKLAREAELCYATVAMVTDYDCWHPEHDDVSVEAVVKVLAANAAKAKALVAALGPRLKDRAGPCEAGCHRALETAVITPVNERDPKMVERLSAVAGRVLGADGPARDRRRHEGPRPALPDDLGRRRPRRGRNHRPDAASPRIRYPPPRIPRGGGLCHPRHAGARRALDRRHCGLWPLARHAPR